MTTTTRDYLLGLALAEKEAAARELIDGVASPRYGQAAAAVKELLNKAVSPAKALAAMRRTKSGGRNGGRPRDPVRCACGKFTLARAIKRNHRCPTATPPKP